MTQPKKLSENVSYLLMEIAFRFFLLAVFWVTDGMEPFHRIIQPEEMWLYKYPKTPSFYPASALWLTVVCSSFFIITGFYLFTKDVEDFLQGLLGALFVFGVCGLIVNSIKLTVGRPRPDFLERCLGDYKLVPEKPLTAEHCVGLKVTVFEGLKSFPSGHSAHSMSSLGYLGFYVAGKFKIFSSRGQSSSWHFIAVVGLFLWPVLIGVSRTMDYHHHWQDVSVGLVLGFFVAYFVYFHSFPALSHSMSHRPFASLSDHHKSHDIEHGLKPMPASKHV